MHWRETDWAQRHRPSRIDELVLPPTLMEKLVRLRNSGGGMSLLFYGPPGCGKTTAARLLNPDSTLEVNCAETNSIDMVRSLRSSCSSLTLDGRRRLVLLDEADGLTRDAQAALRGVSESLSINNDFVMTANYPERLIDAIRSRFHPVDFAPVRDTAHMKRIEDHLRRVSQAEGHTTVSNALLRSTIRQYFPDVRAMLKHLMLELGTACP